MYLLEDFFKTANILFKHFTITSWQVSGLFVFLNEYLRYFLF